MHNKIHYTSKEEPVPQDNLHDSTFKLLAQQVYEVTGNLPDPSASLNDYAEYMRDYLENIINSMPGNVYWMSTKSVFLGCNENVLKLMKLTRKEYVGKTYDDLVKQGIWSPEQVISFKNDDLKVVNTGEPLYNKEEPPLPSPNGELVYYLTSRVPIKSKDNKVIGIVGISIDITDRKAMELDLIKAKEKAEFANQAKSDFISNMEHDLRTPFSGIRGIAGLLHGMEADQEKKSLLDMMIKSCEQWENVHNRIFDALAIEQFIPLKIEVVSIAKILRDLQDEMGATVHIKHLSYVTEPVSDALDKIETDPAKFKLILSCLISNAVKFTEKGGINIRVGSEKGACIVQVKDTGIGIPADKFDYIFEEFTKLSRSNTHASDFQGVGSGLYIAKKYATQLGASIQVESKINEGSIFTVKLPV